MGKGNKSLMGFDLKVFLMLSMALNVVLISRLVYHEKEKDQEIKKICLETKNQKYDTTSSSSVMVDDASYPSPRDAHVSKRKTPFSTTASTDVDNSGDGGGAAADGVIIDLDHGNPTMYEQYWKQMADKTTVVIPGWQFISYFSDVKNICWFLEQEFAKAVIRLHNLVGNAATENHYIVVGTGSSQLYQAVLYALTPTNSPEPMNVVSAAPFYSSYPLMTDYLKSGLHRWAGDAYNFSSDEPYIELVTSPNNPDGSIRQAVVNGDKGILIHDLAYYWPQYTPITHRADHDIMLFTISKSTGHAGTRIGWALVKDRAIAKKMTKFIEINTIGVSKDSQLRAARILQAVSDDYDSNGHAKENEKFFEHSYNIMVKRWKELRAAVKKNEIFSLPRFPPDTCTFSGQTFEPQPAFAWLKCEQETVEDCESFFRSHNILTRGGKHFGVSPKYVRISMLDSNYKFTIFTERLSSIK